MNNFEFKNPTKIIFGKNTIEKLENEIPKDAKVLLLYGGGSIKKNGIYEQVKTALANVNIIEFGGIPANPEYAILIEALFSFGALWYFFKEEVKKGISRTTKNRIAIISVFAYGIIFMLLIATKSFRELFGIPEFDLGFNTNMPTLIFTYGAMLYCLNYFTPKFTLDKKQYGND